MTTTTKYRDADYDIDKYIDKTASFPDGLHEEYRFIPNLPYAVRHTSSSHDISRYERYFALAQSNRGKYFTWRHYLKILRDELRHFDTLILMSKITLHGTTTPLNSEMSHYVTASEIDEATNKRVAEKSKRKRLFSKEKALGGDAESISSMNTSISTSSLTPQTSLLKKMCSDIRSLARMTSKTVDKISKKAKYCSACGDFIGNMKVHKKCTHPVGDVKDCCTPQTPSKIKNKIIRSGSMTFDTPSRTPVGGGEFLMDSRSPKRTVTPQSGCRMKFKKSPKNIN